MVCEVKPMSIKTKAIKLHKREWLDKNAEFRGQAPNAYQNFQKVSKEDTSNRFNSGSAISYSESCAHFGSADGGYLTGSQFNQSLDLTSLNFLLFGFSFFYKSMLYHIKVTIFMHRQQPLP